MKLSTKIIISICFVLFICVAALLIYRQSEILQRQKAIETEFVKQKELVDGITRSSNEYASKKDIEQFIKDNNINLKAIQEDMKKLHVEIVSINKVTANSVGHQGNNLPTTNVGPSNPNPQIPTAECNGKVIPCPKADPYGYLKNRQNYVLNEQFSNINVPIGEIGFSAWQLDPWNTNIKPRTYSLSSVVAVDENNRQIFYNKLSIGVDGKTYDIKIDSATTKQQYPESKFSWWNPRLFLGIDGSLNLSETKGELTAGVTIGFMSMGRYKIQPDISILQVGVGYGAINNKLQFILVPAAYNIGKHIPLMNNMYLGPSIQMNTIGDVYIGAGIRGSL